MRSWALVLPFALFLPDPVFALRGRAPAETGMEEVLQSRLTQNIVQAGQSGLQFHRDNQEQWRPHLILSRWHIKRVAGLDPIPELQEGVPPALIQSLVGHTGVSFAPAASRDTALRVLAAQEPEGTAAVLGMGRGFDIPLMELALRYQKVVLVDLDEPSVRAALDELRQELARLGLTEEQRASVMGRLEVQVADLSGISDRLERFAVDLESRRGALSKADAIGEALLFLDRQGSDPALQSWPLRVTGTYDLVVSSFVVSQISSEILRYLEELITRIYGPQTRQEWVQFHQALPRLSKAAARNHAGHLAGLLAPGGKTYFSSESYLLWPDQNVQSPLFPVNDLLDVARETHPLAVLPLDQWLWMQRMNGVFYPGAGYWVEAYQINRSGLEEKLFGALALSTQP